MLRWIVFFFFSYFFFFSCAMHSRLSRQHGVISWTHNSKGIAAKESSSSNDHLWKVALVNVRAHKHTQNESIRKHSCKPTSKTIDFFSFWTLCFVSVLYGIAFYCVWPLFWSMLLLLLLLCHVILLPFKSIDVYICTIGRFCSSHLCAVQLIYR